MNREDALKAVDDACSEGIKHCYDVFVEGLIEKLPTDELAQHFKNGLAFHCDAHGKLTAVVEDYFKGFKP